ncbi:MAG: heme-copper oxidase subunit III [Acidobacteria bacterium]|nr:heme-copper oxidase subunit III [Acidobacteriota bacterium]
MITNQTTPDANQSWVLPARGPVGMLALIVAESAIFFIFVVAYIYNIGRSISGPTPKEVLDVPIFITICLLSSSLTIWLAERAVARDRRGMFTFWWLTTFLLGSIFLGGTAREWHTLIYRDNFTISTNLFGTTFYSLVGLHATHVLVGLVGILIVLVFALFRKVDSAHAYRLNVFGLYWHFVDTVWVVVFTVVYLVGR